MHLSWCGPVSEQLSETLLEGQDGGVVGLEKVCRGDSGASGEDMGRNGVTGEDWVMEEPHQLCPASVSL